MPYRKPPRTTPSCVILWDRQRHIGNSPGYLFATALEAEDFWQKHSGRKLKEAEIQRIQADSKREFLSTIQQLLVGA